MLAEEKVKLVASLAADIKARDVLILNLTGISPVTDFFVICTADSTTHMSAIIENVERGLKEKQALIWGREGDKNSNWQLLDCGDVVFHVFLQEARNYYEIERLWADATTLS